ncbi:phosphatidylserine decarboxylase [Tribonema minus]|uniref:Phosphatidylserine decarboxylase n=1 Tax=Tribonema minus TaxID=303371 RepID=A0A835YXN1_9STRA|nr:phosphatidylserine decarboxylase [Tribonema minus]
MDKIKQQAKWLPEDPARLHHWLRQHHEGVGKREKKLLHPACQALKDLIDGDGICRMLLTRAIDQVDRDSVEYHYLDSPETMVEAIDAVLEMAPEYDPAGPVCFPISAILVLTLSTPAGFEAYRNTDLNRCFKGILNAWCEFLSSERSTYVLHGGRDGWMSADAQAQLGMADYEHDPDAQHWGYRSWNDFFTRRLSTKGDPRPLAGRDDHSVIVAGCDSIVYRVTHNAQLTTKFWIKTQSYSLLDMLAHCREYASKFIGGDVLQAYLSALSYHRWHAPVSGKVLAAWVVDGTYFSELGEASGPPWIRRPPKGPSKTFDNCSQRLHSARATRAVYIIEADDPAIGLVAFVAVGMAEFSSSIIREDLRRAPGASGKPPPHVNKGDEIGYFQFGGSTHCVVFRKGAVDEFLVSPGDSIEVGQHVATAASAS